jgi:hypothetical protein
VTGTDGLRQQIAEALRGKQWIRKVRADGSTSILQTDEFDLADALLPVVTAWAEQQARQRAAKELQAAAEELRSDRDDATTGEDPGDPWTYNEAALTCTQRADALADEDPA